MANLPVKHSSFGQKPPKTGTTKKVAKPTMSLTFAELKQSGVEISPDLPEWAWSLTMMQLRYVSELMVDMSPYRAVLRCGFGDSDHERRNIAARFASDEAVRKAVALQMVEDRKGFAALRQRMVVELSALSFYNPGDYTKIAKNMVTMTDFDQLTEEQLKAIKRIKQTTGKTECLELEFHDKVKAMELLDRMTGGGPQGINVNNNTQNVIHLSVTAKEAKAL